MNNNHLLIILGLLLACSSGPLDMDDTGDDASEGDLVGPDGTHTDGVVSDDQGTGGDSTADTSNGGGDQSTPDDSGTEDVVSGPSPTRIEAECAHGSHRGDCGGAFSGSQNGTELENGETTVGYIEHADYLAFTDVDLTGYDTLTLRYAKDSSVPGGAVDIRVGSASGQRLATVNPGSTGGWQSWQQTDVALTTMSGPHTLYVVAQRSDNPDQGILNLDWLELSAGGASDGGTGDGGTGDGGTGDGGTGDGGTAVDDGSYPPLTSGASAGTTRYWDCCKPHCAWHRNMNTCDVNGTPLSDGGGSSGCDGGGTVYTCNNYAPFEVSNTLSYGFVAFNNAGNQCGDCYQLDFQGTLSGKRMVVQSTNIGDGGTDSFDILIPGGGVGQFAEGCRKQWGNVDFGVTYGGFYASCNGDSSCIRGMCQNAFGDKSDLMAGCNWFLGWFQNANNPSVIYKKVTCPPEIIAISGMGN